MLSSAQVSTSEPQSIVHQVLRFQKRASQILLSPKAPALRSSKTLLGSRRGKNSNASSGGRDRSSVLPACSTSSLLSMGTTTSSSKAGGATGSSASTSTYVSSNNNNNKKQTGSNTITNAISLVDALCQDTIAKTSQLQQQRRQNDTTTPPHHQDSNSNKLNRELSFRNVTTTTTASIVREACSIVDEALDELTKNGVGNDTFPKKGEVVRKLDSSSSSPAAAGEYRTITQNDFFQESGDEGTTIVHFYNGDDNDTTTKQIDSILQEMTLHYPDTRFLRINGKLCPFLAPKMGIQRFPTILALQNGGTRIVDKLCDYELTRLLLKQQQHGDQWDMEDYIHDWINDIVCM